MADASTRTNRKNALATEQREALWKWRWLGWRDSTPAFKACLVLLAAMAFAIVAYSMVPMPRP